MVTRINGFSNSGLNIDDLVSKLMKAERIPLDKYKQNKQVLEWKRDDYRSINTTLLDFRNAVSTMKYSSAYNSRKVSVSDDTVISATATNAANQGIYSIKVDQLAESAHLTSSAVGGNSSSTTLNSLSITSNAELTIKGAKGAATILVNTSTTDDISSIVSTVNAKSSITGVSVTYDETLGRFFWSSTSTGADAEVNLQSMDTTLLTKLGIAATDSTAETIPLTGETVVAAGTASFSSSSKVINSSIASSETLRLTYGGTTEDFEITSTTTIGQLIDRINSSDVGQDGLSAYLDSNGKLKFFKPDNTQALSITDETVGGIDLVSNLGMDSTTSNVAAYKLKYEVGKNAIVDLNGVNDVEYSSNTFSFAGITFTAKKVDATAVSVGVTQDTDTIYNSIKTLIDKYNEVVEKLDMELNEEKYKDYLPLTDEERESLSEDQIEKWEEKAKSGLLRNDSILKDAMSKFRSALTGTVTGFSSDALSDLSEIGITTQSYFDKGRLYIDETKLKNAISNNIDEVAALFSTTDGTDSSDDGDGVAIRLYDRITDLMDQVKDKAGSSSESLLNTYTIGNSILDLNERINRFEDSLIQIEDRYYRQFTAMEQALSQLNQQSASLFQNFS